MNSLYILDISPVSEVLFANIFSHSVGYFFVLLMASFVLQKLLFDIVPPLFFACTYLDFEVKFTETSLRPRFISLVPMFSSMYFIVLDLIFRSLIHFELIFAGSFLSQMVGSPFKG